MTDLPTAWRTHSVQPERHGQPWTDDDYESLVAAVRRGLEPQEIAREIGRAPSTILTRVRTLLPVDVRQCPVDRVLAAARDAFEMPDYDWRVTILQSPPPAPVITPPAVVREGIAGLEPDDLGTIAFSLAHTGGAACADLLERVCAELHQAPGALTLAESLAERWLRRSGAALGWGVEPREAAYAWLSAADGWAHSTSHHYPAWDPYAARREPFPSWGSSS